MSWFRRIASRIDDALDERRMRARVREGQDDPVVVVPYPGWGTGGRIHLRGSVTERAAEDMPREGAGLWQDLAITVRRFTAAEIMGARVRVTCGEASVVGDTDSDGFFEVALDTSSTPGWRGLKVTLEGFPGMSQAPLTVDGRALVPAPDAGVAVISDIDDTIIRTGIAEPLKNWRTIVESDADARVAFPGLPQLYRGLQSAEGRGAAGNPIFYVSSGSWRLYGLIERFMTLNGIPRGPMFMDDWGLTEDRWFKSSHGAHKAAAIDRLMALYPNLRFILVGDSGQADSEIYADVAGRHPGRVLAIWIRDVSGEARDAEVATILDAVRGSDMPVFVEETLLEAARDAAARGWLKAGALNEVERAVAKAQTAA